MVSHSVSSDDDEAPESLSLEESRRDVQKHTDKLQQFREAEKEKKRARNRERDRRLKEQAERGRRRRTAADEPDIDLEARMKRAMEDAEAESDSDDSESVADRSDSTNGDDGENFEDEHDVGEAGGKSHAESNDEGNRPLAEAMPNPNHLPDHLFTSAFNSQTVQSRTTLKKREVDEQNSNHQAKKRARRNNSAKDVLVGSRTIRTLNSDQHPSGAGTIPSSRVKKFTDRVLALKGGNPKTRGWERRAANIGSMRHIGPAANFVRNR